MPLEEDKKDNSFIYEYALEFYKDNIELNKRLEEKARRYITIIAIFLSAQVLVLRFVIDL